MDEPSRARLGKIRWLAAALDRASGPLDADLQRFYGLALGDFPEVWGWGRLVSLAEALPAEAATVRWANAGEPPWTRTEMLLALVADLLAGANWQRGGGKGVRPRPVPRPGVGPENTRIGGGTSYTLAEMRALLDRHTRGQTD